MADCIFCDNELTAQTKPEHILLSALGGRKTTKGVVCSHCNGSFGSTIDNAVGDQIATLRNMLQLPSGTGNPPPMRRQIRAGSDTINMKSDGTLELVAKPFSVTPLGNGRSEVGITARSFEDIANYLPHIAAKVGCSEAELLEYLGSATGRSVSRRPDVELNMPFGGNDSVRSFAKACLVLWATFVGNQEVKSARYEAARNFIANGDDDFAEFRVHLDSRPLPHVDELKRRFGDFFNLVYIRSDDSGRVIGHFTLYNIKAWRFVLAESGAPPDVRIGLASNPNDPKVWSGKIADEIDIAFSWLNGADDTDGFKRTEQRLGAAIERSQREAMTRELVGIIRRLCEKYGVDELASVADPALQQKIVAEFSQRVASHMMGIPYEETLSGVEIVARIRSGDTE